MPALRQPTMLVATPCFDFSLMTRRLTAKKTKKKYKLKTRKSAVRRFKVVSKRKL
jgi:hypothetical protein